MQEIPSRTYNDDVMFICKIRGVEAIEKEYGKLKNYDVILTEERRKHILVRRGIHDYKIIMDNLKDTLVNYDEIYDDSRGNKKGVCYIKKLYDNKYCSIYISLSLISEEFANSNITGILLNQKRVLRLKNKRKLIDKAK